MRKISSIFTAFFLILALAAPANAKPNWRNLVHEKKNWRTIGRIALYTAAVVSTVESAHQTNLCRDRVDIAQCQGGYGEVGARQVANGFLTGGLIVLSEWGHHEKFKEWFVPVTAVTAYNFTTAVQQSRIHERKKE